MFTAREQLAGGHGGLGAGGVAALPAPVDPRALLGDLGERLRALRDGFTQRVSHLHHAIEAHCRHVDLAPDLAEDIGSAQWFRGLGTLVGLSAVALAFWPDFSAIETASAMPIDRQARDEFRSQMIMPLALGADNGRRMAANSAVVPLAFAPERPTVELTATLGQGDSFARMLQRAGVSAGDAGAVAALVGSSVPVSGIDPGTRFAITLGRRPADGQSRPLDKLSFRARFDLALAIERRAGGLVVTPRPIAVDATPLRIRGAVGNSLYRSARAAGAPLKAIQQYLRTLDSHLNLEGDVAPGDTFDIVIAYKRAASGESEAGDLLYAGLEGGGKAKAQLLRWGSDGQFFEASGLGKQTAGMVAPVNGRMTSQFGMRRHPILGYVRMHAGIDFGAAWGSPIFAVSDGTVSYAGRHGGHGNYVRIEHGGGIGTGYAHMSRIAVAPGTRVHTGQVIGYVGSSGLSTGPHLHYELYRNGATVNPLSVRFTVQAQVSGKELAAFKARLAQMKAVTPGAALKGIAPRQAEVRLPQREIDRIGN